VHNMTPRIGGGIGGESRRCECGHLHEGRRQERGSTCGAHWGMRIDRESPRATDMIGTGRTSGRRVTRGAALRGSARRTPRRRGGSLPARAGSAPV
jgi:hypothetical protein